MALILVYLVGLDIHGLIGYNRIRREVKTLTLASRKLALVNQRQEHYLLARSDEQLEDGWIRQELGYVKPGEIAVVFLSKAKQQHE